MCAVRVFWGLDETGPMMYVPNVGVDGNQIHWDSLKPFPDADMFMSSDTFPPWLKKGLNLGFSESVLLTSEQILVNHFGLEPLRDGLSLQNEWPNEVVH